MDTNIFSIGIISILLILFLALALYVSNRNSFWQGFLVLTIQVVVGVTAYYSFTDSQNERTFIAYEKGRQSASRDRLD